MAPPVKLIGTELGTCNEIEGQFHPGEQVGHWPNSFTVGWQPSPWLHAPRDRDYKSNRSAISIDFPSISFHFVLCASVRSASSLASRSSRILITRG